MSDAPRKEPAFGGQLTAGDYQNLESSWITKELADKAFLRRVDSFEGQDLVGQKKRDCAGILIPYYLPGEATACAYRLRRDNPEMVSGSDGRLKPERKYLGAPGDRNRIYFPPGITPEQLTDTAIPLTMTEGEKKALALQRLATCNVVAPRLIPIAFSGVWNWRGVIGKTTGPNGERLDEKGPIPDLDRIAFAGRMVYIVFDANVHTNSSVQQARVALARELTNRGAEVLFVDIPEDCGVNGIDDLLALWGPDRILELFDQAAPPEEKQKLNQAQTLLEVVRDVKLFRTPEGEPFAEVLQGDRRDTFILTSENFRLWLSRRYYKTLGKPVSTPALHDAIGLLKARALFDAPVAPLFVRIAETDGRLFLDLGNEKGSIVEINKDGWRIVQEAPVYFVRSKTMRPLPEPMHGGSVELLRPLINVTDDSNWILLISWLVGAFHPTGPYPILILQGGQGSAKSTLSRFIRRIIDPAGSLLFAPPKDERDLLIAARGSRILAFDNLSGVQSRLADALCRLSTGGGYLTRQLYTDGEPVTFESARPVILNGIDRLAERADLADRAIILHLPLIQENRRKDEAQLIDQFERDLPLILGALLSGVSAALANVNTVQLPRSPRLADFARWVTASEPALGFPPGAFLGAYLSNRASIVQESLEDDALGEAILSQLKLGEPFEGTCGEFLAVLSRSVGEDVRRSRDWPKSPRQLSGRLRRLDAFLRESGVRIEFDRRTNRRRLLRAERTGLNSTVTTVTCDTRSTVSPIDQSFAEESTGDGSPAIVTVTEDATKQPSPDQTPQAIESEIERDGVTEVTVDRSVLDMPESEEFAGCKTGCDQDWIWDEARKVWYCPTCGKSAPLQRRLRG